MIIASPLLDKIVSYERKEISEFSTLYQENKLKVLKVVPKNPTTKAPILLIPAMINKYYILDISETNSLCKSLSELGYPVYVLDWGTATSEDRWQTFSEVFTGSLKRIITKVTRDSGDKPVLFGYCMGGSMSTIYSAMYPDEVKGLIALTAPIDFSKAGIMAKWTSKPYLNPNTMIDAIGNVPPELTQSSFVSMKPAKWFKKWEVAWNKQDNEAFMDSFLTLENWVNDNIPFPGGVWQEYITWLYQENRLFNDTLTIGNKKASLKNLTCPILTLVATDDHIVPPEAAEPLHNLAGSELKEIEYFKGGHVGIISSPKLFPQLVKSVDTWLSKI